MSMFKMKDNNVCLKNIEINKSSNLFKKNTLFIYPEIGNSVTARVLWFNIIDDILQNRKLSEISDEELTKLLVFNKYDFIITRIVHTVYKYNNQNNKLESSFVYCEKDNTSETNIKLAKDIIKNNNINNFNDLYNIFLKEKKEKVKNNEINCKICNIIDDIRIKYSKLFEIKKENNINDEEFNNDLKQIGGFLKLQKKYRTFVPVFVINDKLHPENHNQVKLLLLYDINAIYNLFNLVDSMKIFFNNLSKPDNYNLEISTYEYKNKINTKLKLIKNIDPIINKNIIKNEEEFYNTYIKNTGFDLNNYLTKSNENDINKFYNIAIEMLNSTNIILDKYNITDINKNNSINTIVVDDNNDNNDFINNNQEIEKIEDNVKEKKEELNKIEVKEDNSKQKEPENKSDDFIEDFINSLNI